ncbi:MAG: sulfotransferase family 2 domain-containing protein [Candidatus Limnocylindrales bacterium]
MAIVCRDHRLLFILTPHTASTAVAALLRARLAGEWLPPQEITDGRGSIIVRRKHSTVAELLEHGVLSNAERAGLVAFSAVRNPFDVLVSLYLKHSLKDQDLLARPGAWIHRRQGKLAAMEYARQHSFDQWIERQLSRPPRRPLMEHQQGVDVVLRYERLQQDFDAFLIARGLEPIEIPPRNVTHERRSRHYREFYVPATRALVERAYASSLERFDYSF